MKLPVIHSRTFGDMVALWTRERDTVDFALVPAGMEAQIPEHRDDTNDAVAVRGIRAKWGMNVRAHVQFSAVQAHLRGDADAGEFGASMTMCCTESVARLKFAGIEDGPDATRLTLVDPERKLRYEQVVSHREGDRFVRIRTSVANEGDEAAVVDHLDSFSLGCLSPFRRDDGPGAYEVLRWRSFWSNEGVADAALAETLGLERSWSTSGLRVLRFGQLGGMPSRGFNPVFGLLDREAGVIWGAALDALMSWRAEFFRRGDFLSMSGGLPDADYGQWSHRLEPGQRFVTPDAAVTCARGDAQTLQARLVGAGQGPVLPCEEAMPTLFNDWCADWGDPSPENILPVAERLVAEIPEEVRPRYLVLDSGWYRGEEDHNHGDWEPKPAMYPDGIGALAARLRAMGFVPGIWFEFEIAFPQSGVFRRHPDWFVRKNGRPYVVGNRAFFDFRKPEVWAYFDERLVGFLRENGFGYLKTDYNATIGSTLDGADGVPDGATLQSLGEAVMRYFRHLREQLPDLVLEVCASGGHRLSPPWMRICSMASFSDAHEGVDIPIVAANVTGLIPARKSQIWATLHEDDGENRLCYLLAGGFLGRLCLSGPVAKLQDWQFAVVRKALALYAAAAPVIRNGDWRIDRAYGPAHAKPQGHQVAVCTAPSGTLAVVHTFENAPSSLTVPFRGPVRSVLAPAGVTVSHTATDSVVVSGLADYQGVVLL